MASYASHGIAEFQGTNVFSSKAVGAVRSRSSWRGLRQGDEALAEFLARNGFQIPA